MTAMNFGLYFVNGRYGNHWQEARRYYGARLNVFRDWELRVTPVTRTGRIIAPLYLADVVDGFNDGHGLGLFSDDLPLISSDSVDEVITASITALRPHWKRLLALELADEPKWKPAETARLLRMVNDEIKRQKLPPRPSVVVYTRDQILNGRNWDVPGIVPGLECYLDYEGPESNATARRRMAVMISSQLARVGNRKVLLVGQAYDRNFTYQDKESLVAIQQPIFDAARRLQSQGRLLALTPFAYARPGGVLAYPAMKAEIRRLLQA